MRSQIKAISNEEAVPTAAYANSIPLCVDLDGTLIRSDLLLEALFGLLRQNPLVVFLLPWWLLHGKAYFKRRVAERVALDADSLPYHQDVLDYLKQQHMQGRPLVLATASDQMLAKQVADHLGLFEQVIASDGQRNLKGIFKAAVLKEAFGVRGFDYAGNDRADLQVWLAARRGIVVNANRSVEEAAERTVEVEHVFPKGDALKGYIKALRIHQWLKNLLVFMPLLASHRVLEIELLTAAGLAFLSFGLCASSVYILNDLLDLSADRRHPSKRLRPIAAGTVPILHATLLAPVFLLAAVGLALLLPTNFLLVLTGYYALTLAYSFGLKRKPVLDVLLLAGLYTVRIIAGAAAVAVAPSFWLLAFSIFLFLSLALVKRYAELLVMLQQGRDEARGRGYQVSDLPVLLSLGTASGLLSVLVLALYINSPQIEAMYSHSEAIWLLCPLLLYWVSRIWLKTHRGEMHDDPVIFAVSDSASRWLGLIGSVVLWVAL